jgi:hypothetical protein
MANKLEKSEAAPAATERKIPELEAKHVTVSDAGQAWREVLVRMPKDMTADDLRDPKIWKRVQAVRNTALIKFDNLLIFTFDESQYIRAIVTHATSTEAHLAIERVGTFREQAATFFNDGTLEVFWDGGAYSVRRMSDQVRVVSQGFSTEGQAIAALRESYPKVA